LPNPVSKTRDIENKLYIPKILYNFKGDPDDQIILMRPFSFYTYQGSLPFPPCSERTINFVASEPLKVGSTTINLFKEALSIPDLIEKNGDSFDVVTSDWLPISNREVQEKNGRPIFHYDFTKYCPNTPALKPIKPKGHYEKIQKDVTNYFYVNGSKPSGIPGSLLVTEDEANGNTKNPAPK